MKSWIFFFSIFIIFLGLGGYMLAHPPPQSTTPKSSALPSAAPSVLGVVTGNLYSPPPQTKTSDCVVNGPFPDTECTPGAVFPDVTVQQICTSGYSKSVRNVSQATKDQVYAEYGVTHHVTGEYEVDHHISLELGGSNEIANLWPEAANPTPGFHQKDEVENYLHDQVCSGKIQLGVAQQLIATNWLSVYKKLHPGL